MMSYEEQTHGGDEICERIGMAYVPRQKWRKVYSCDYAFPRGTIFAELDMPFRGRKGGGCYEK